MSGFEVDPPQLRQSGARLDELAGECAVHPALRYSAQPRFAGDPLLAAALETFQDASATAVKQLVEDLAELGARLNRGAGMYEDHEAERGAGIRNPDAAESGPAASPRPSNAIAAALS
jgi:hypothetical protein